MLSPTTPSIRAAKRDRELQLLSPWATPRCRPLPAKLPMLSIPASSNQNRPGVSPWLTGLTQQSRWLLMSAMAMAEAAATAFAPVLRENFDFGCNVIRIDEFLLRRCFRAVGVSLWILLPPTSLEADEIGRIRLAQTEPQAKPSATDPTTVAPTPPARAVKNSAPARSK